MSEAKASPAIEFLEARKPIGKSGGPLAQYWFVFRVGEKKVNVFVHFGAIGTLDRKRLSEDECKLAARTLIEMEIENHRDLSDVGEGLVVDKGAMFHITHRLGWRGRFYKSV